MAAKRSSSIHELTLLRAIHTAAGASGLQQQRQQRMVLLEKILFQSQRISVRSLSSFFFPRRLWMDEWRSFD